MPSFLRNLKILEVSSVDRGAGDGVKVILMKRDADLAKAWGEKYLDPWKPEDVTLLVEHPGVIEYAKRTFTADQRQAAEDKGQAMPGGGFPIVNASDLENAIHAIGRAKDPSAAKAHIKERAKALGREDLLPDTWKRLAKADEVDLDAITVTKQEIDMTLDELNKLIGEQVSKAITEMSTKLPEMVTKAVDESVKKAFPPKKPGNAAEDAKDKGADDAEETDAQKALAIAALPASVRKVLDTAEDNAKLVQKFMADRALEEYAKKAVALGLKKEDGVLMQKAYSGDPAAQKAFEERIAQIGKAKVAQLDTAVIFSEFGHNNGTAGGEGGVSAYDQLMSKAKELRKVETGLTESQAFAKVMTDPANKELAIQEKQERLQKIHRIPVN